MTVLLMGVLFLGKSNSNIRGSVGAQTIRMVHQWWTVYEGDGRMKSSSLGRQKKINHNRRVSWADKNNVDETDSKKVESTQSSLDFGSYRADWNLKELPRKRSPQKRTMNQSPLSDTAYQVFEKSVSSHAKKVEENPPESFSDYKITWDESN